MSNRLNDKIKTVNIVNHPLTVPKLHGHMRLELDSCRVHEVHEHDNMMTDFFERIFNNKGIWIDSYDIYKSLSPSNEKAFGAIQLVDKSIPESAHTLPGGIEVTACAAYGYANNDIALTMGSYNTKESSFDSKSRKMTYVYDWTSNQGNGTIAAAALTNQIAGNCGYGDSAYELNATPASVTQAININHELSFTKELIYIDDTYMVFAETENNKLRLYRTYNNMKNMYPIFNQTNDEYTKYHITEFQTTDLKFNNDKWANRRCYTTEDGVYLINDMYIASGKTAIIYKVTNISSEEPQLEEITIKNNSDKRINTIYGIEEYNGYIYFLSDDYKYLIEVNIANQADTNAYYIYTGYISYINSEVNPREGKLYLSGNYGTVIFDTVTKSVKLSRIKKYTKYIRNVGEHVIGCTSGSSKYYIVEPWYLATINNLDKSVVKTADKTMKVTYIIQE